MSSHEGIKCVAMKGLVSRGEKPEDLTNKGCYCDKKERQGNCGDTLVRGFFDMGKEAVLCETGDKYMTILGQEAVEAQEFGSFKVSDHGSDAIVTRVFGKPREVKKLIFLTRGQLYEQNITDPLPEPKLTVLEKIGLRRWK